MTRSALQRVRLQGQVAMKDDVPSNSNGHQETMPVLHAFLPIKPSILLYAARRQDGADISLIDEAVSTNGDASTTADMKQMLFKHTIIVAGPYAPTWPIQMMRYAWVVQHRAHS